MLSYRQILHIHSALLSNELSNENNEVFQNFYRFHRIVLDSAHECIEMFIENNNRIGGFLNRNNENGTSELEVLSGLKLNQEVLQIVERIVNDQTLDNTYINSILTPFSAFIELILENEIENKIENVINQNSTIRKAKQIAEFAEKNLDKLNRNFDLRRRTTKILNDDEQLEIDDLEVWIRKFETLASKLDRIQDEYWEMTFLYFALIKSYEFLFRFLTRHGINLNNQTNNNQNIYFSLRCADRFRNKFRHFLIERPQRQHFEILREAAYNWATANRLESIISYCIENGYPLSILSLEVPTYDTDYITAWLETI
jgi:hypothetical protein